VKSAVATTVTDKTESINTILSSALARPVELWSSGSLGGSHRVDHPER
jgi:hypothetical protein